MPDAYYNEFDPFAAQWLRNLIAAGHIAAGDVDDRSILDVKASDLAGYAQCHFFAGIGGWSLALRLAGWDDEREVWTGSCPCQPFSLAGRGAGAADERHLWPVWSRLIRECRPRVVFGEQVAAAIGHGWLDAVFDDLEDEGYACAPVVLPACGVGAPHLRQRLWFVADRQEHGRGEGRAPAEPGRLRHACLWSDADGRESASELGDACRARVRRDGGTVPGAQGAGRGVGIVDGHLVDEPGVAGTAWRACDWLPCRDGKARPVEPGTFPLAHGVPGRVGRLRAYGNAIVPQVAAEVIGAFMECAP